MSSGGATCILVPPNSFQLYQASELFVAIVI